MKSADKADIFAGLWRMLAPRYMPEPQREYRFNSGTRHRFDFAWPPQRVSVEVDGGNWMVRNGKPVGRHTKDSDLFKLNLAATLGWRVLRFSPGMLERQPNECIEAVCEALAYTPER